MIDKLLTISLNGVEIHYLVTGDASSRPVLLLHGNSGSHHDFDITISQLVAAGYLVFALDSRGQGDNKPLEEYHYVDMVEDVHLFVKNIFEIIRDLSGIENTLIPFVYGWSDGGIVALMTEMKYHQTFATIVTSGVNLYPEGFVGIDDLASMEEDIKTAPPLLKMCFTEPQIQPQKLNSITCPVLILAGEDDIVKNEHTHLIAANIENSEILILKGEDHESYIKHSEKIGEILLKWFVKI